MMTSAEWINKARTYHGNRYDYSETVYLGAMKKVKVICPKHGPWWMLWRKRGRSEDTGVVLEMPQAFVDRPLG